MAGRYKLRCSLIGHNKDVRAVTPALYPDGGIISVSRDVTARVWKPNENDLGFTEAHVMSGHNNFVNCVCVMPPDDRYPHGLIMTGSADHNILAFTLDSPTPVFKLEGHTNTVCSLASGKYGTLVSGSWDQTAKVWLNEKCLMTLKGHSAPVWCVTILPEGGFMLSGSADKTIKMWRAGKCEKTFIGHEDCVRGLAVLSTKQFLSCANDASVKHWSTDGSCLNTYYGHTNYIYSITLLPNGKDFVTSGEDRTMRVWSDGICVQTVAHPTESVWSVCVLANGDIVTGASDGIVRVFSSDKSRQGSEEVQKAYEEHLASSSIPAQIGDISTSQLPGPEALINPGKRDGQNLMIKDDGSIQMYQWDAAACQWNKIGEVVGGSGGSQASSSKQLYEGKEYDYVFDVEIQEGSPPLKLPYNLTEDPWMAAHNFLAKHDLSQMLLDQVAKFIMDQTKGLSLGPAPSPTVSDPLTGSGRYIPGSGDTSGFQTTASDPFTGASSYKTSSATPEPVNKNFPVRNVITFDQANINGILGKLKEFNSHVESEIQASENEIGRLAELLNGETLTETDLKNLTKLLQWPPAILFPVLDVVRLLIRTEITNHYFCSQKKGVEFLDYLLSFIAADAPVHNQMLSLRIVCNIFKNEPGRSLLLAHRDRIISTLISYSGNSNKNIQIAISTVLLNYAIMFLHQPDIEAKSQCLSAAVTVSEQQSDPEASYRLLTCIGTLISGDENSIELAKSLGVSSFINRCKLIGEPAKVSECANQLEHNLK